MERPWIKIEEEDGLLFTEVFAAMKTSCNLSYLLFETAQEKNVQATYTFRRNWFENFRKRDRWHPLSVTKRVAGSKSWAIAIKIDGLFVVENQQGHRGLTNREENICVTPASRKRSMDERGARV